MERLRAGEDVKLKVRLSTTGEDVRLLLNTMETIGMAKKKLQDQEGVQEPSTQRWYFGGKLLGKFRLVVSISSLKDSEQATR